MKRSRRNRRHISLELEYMLEGLCGISLAVTAFIALPMILFLLMV